MSFIASPSKSQKDDGIGIFDSLLHASQNSEEVLLSRVHHDSTIRPHSSGHVNTTLGLRAESSEGKGQESNPGVRSDDDDNSHSPIQIVTDLKAIKTTEKGEF